MATIALSPAASAQDTETVIVTGSRIPQRSLEGVSPVNIVGQQTIQFQGAVSIGQSMRDMPSVVQDGDSDTTNNGTGGISSIDLRNLGTKRTLVLVDGKRLVPATSSLDVDTNVIPAGMVDRVEVLTGGDSAVYGSDAVAGVVNIILKKNFEGLMADTQMGISDGAVGFKSDTYMMLGVNTPNGKGNITMYGEYMHRDPVSFDKRPWGEYSLASTNYTGCAGPAVYYGGYCHSGSGTIEEGRIKSPALGGIDPLNNLPLAGPNSQCQDKKKNPVGCNTMFTADGKLANYDGRTFNFSPYNFYQTHGQRYSLGAEGHYEFSKYATLYSRLTFADNYNKSQIAPTPVGQNFYINCGNPLMSAQQRATIFGSTSCSSIDASLLAGDTGNANGNAGITDPNKYQRLVSVGLRMTSVGPRIDTEDHSAYQFVGGLRGELPLPGWSYDVSAQYGHTAEQNVYLNDESKANFQNALLVDPTTGLCYSDKANCKPLNLFTAGGLTDKMAGYLRQNMVLVSSVDQWDLQAAFTGDLGFIGGKSPWAHDPIGLSLGTEYRQEAASTTPDQNLATGNLLGFNRINPIEGHFNVKEGFIETMIPIVQGMELIQDLTARAAYRFSSYDKSGDTNTYKLGLEYTPLSDIKFRASYDRAVRAPNVYELFSPVGGSSADSGKDPCSSSSTVATTIGLCTATGVPLASVFSSGLDCPTNQCQAARSGNEALKPEKATTRTLGIVLSPSFLEGFTAAIDFYDIKIKDYITYYPMPTILQNCYSTAINTTQDPTNAYCRLVHRDALGSITTSNDGYVITQEDNLAKDHVRGMDFDVNYITSLDFIGLGNIGNLATNYTATWVLTNTLSMPNAPDLKCIGVWGPQCGEPQHRFKGNLRFTWSSPSDDLMVSMQWRHTSGVEFEQNRTGFVNDPMLKIPAYEYFDLSAVWNITETFSFRAGIRDLFDKDPPITDSNSAPASNGSGNTFPNSYDALGRTYFWGLNVKL